MAPLRRNYADKFTRLSNFEDAIYGKLADLMFPKYGLVKT